MAEQLQTAFASHGTRIERAKSTLTVQEGIDDVAAFERLRRAARISQGPLTKVVDEVFGDEGLEPAEQQRPE